MLSVIMQYVIMPVVIAPINQSTAWLIGVILNGTIGVSKPHSRQGNTIMSVQSKQGLCKHSTSNMVPEHAGSTENAW